MNINFAFINRLSFSKQHFLSQCSYSIKHTRRYHLNRPLNPLAYTSGHESLLPLVHSCSNLVFLQSSGRHLVGTKSTDGSITNKETVVPFLISHEDPKAVGFLRSEVVKAIIRQEQQNKHTASIWDLRYSNGTEGNIQSISFAGWVNEGGKYSRTMHMEGLIREWKEKGMFTDILRGWSNEAYPIFYHAPQTLASPIDPIAFAIERAALPLFGFPNFGCLLTAYFHDPQTGRMMFWIPRRSKFKRTWPGKLDVTVGGGLGIGDTAMSTIIRECAEEALLDANYVQTHIRPVGVLPFPNRSPAGWILPGTYYLFELQLPPDQSIFPRINPEDGEVEAFELMDAELVLQNLLDGKFKSSSALALVDFLLRHGFITEDSDPRYIDVCRLLKRDVDLPVAWRT